MRVAYAGNFTGTIRANGFERDATGFGVGNLQISISSGTLLVDVAKDDGSERIMVVQVYRDGAMIATASTVKPRGVVDIAVKV